jgi:HAD superfamily hydrolase (TIGR01509 family)
VFGEWIPDAVVFDCDGLLVDTEPCWTVAEAELFRRRGLPFGDAEKASLIGTSVPAACATLADAFADGATAAEIESELLARVAAIVARDAQAMPGAAGLVAHVLARRPAAVASNSPRALLDQALAHGGFAETFEVTLAADEVTRPKPEPELYLTACAHLGVDPRRCLALEDSATGIAAATAAGLRTVGVPTLAGRDIGAEVTVGSLADPELVTWVESWSTDRERE